MNRREFTASLAALMATPALPLAARAPAVAATAVPPGAYAWAKLIAQSQNRCSPQMLARALHLKPDVAGALFKDMVVDGVLQTPGASGLARATQPFETTGLERNTVRRLKSKAKDLAKRAFSSDAQSNDQPALVNTDHPSLGCTDPSLEDQTHASPDQSLKESPESG